MLKVMKPRKEILVDEVLQVVELASGSFAVRLIGGSSLNATLAELAIRAEAENG